jgi:hypothetical protein
LHYRKEVIDLRVWRHFAGLCSMNRGKTVWAQILEDLHAEQFRRCAQRHPMKRETPALSAYDHFAAMVFAQLTYRESLRDIEACLGSRRQLLYSSGSRGEVKRCNLAYANEHRDWQLFADVAAVLMRRARRLYQDRPAELGLEGDLFALDATLIELNLALFPWARWQRNHAALKLNVLLDLRGDIPAFVSLHEGDRHEIHALDEIPVYSGRYYVMDRGFTDFERLARLDEAEAWFVIRAKGNLRFYVAQSRPVKRATGLRCDQTIRLRGFYSKHYPGTLRRIRFYDSASDPSLVFLTNHFELSALTIASIYRERWQIELFFPWIKQHLRLRGFFSTHPNGVRVQVWSAISAYLLVAIAKRELALPGSLH